MENDGYATLDLYENGKSIVLFQRRETIKPNYFKKTVLYPKKNQS
jgi:hypothetical protein